MSVPCLTYKFGNCRLPDGHDGKSHKLVECKYGDACGSSNYCAFVHSWDDISQHPARLSLVKAVHKARATAYVPAFAPAQASSPLPGKSSVGYTMEDYQKFLAFQQMLEAEKSLAAVSLALPSAPAADLVNGSWADTQELAEGLWPNRPCAPVHCAQPSATTVTSVASPAAQVTKVKAAAQEAKAPNLKALKAERKDTPKSQANKPAKTPAQQRAKGPRAERGPSMFSQYGKLSNLVTSLPTLATKEQEFEKAQEQIAKLVQGLTVSVADFTRRIERLSKHAKVWQDSKARERDLRKQVAEQAAEIEKLRQAQAPPANVEVAQPLEQSDDSDPIDEQEPDEEELELPPQQA